MAEVTIKIIDNDNGNVSLFMEAIPALQGNEIDSFTSAQQLGIAFMGQIVKKGVDQFISSANEK